MREETKVRAVPLATAYHYTIDGPIRSGEHQDFHDLLLAVTPNDQVYLHLNTPGGCLDECTALLHSIRRSEAVVVGCADGLVASAGSILFFACQGWEVGDYCSVMLHDGSEMSAGKVNENKLQIEATSKRLKKLYSDVYGPFFTKSEIKKVLDGKDIYLKAEETIKRLETAIDSTDTNEED